MNTTLASDWDFHARASGIWHKQVRAYGERRLLRDVDGFQELRRMLVEVCGGQPLEERGRLEFLTACVFNSRQPDCARQRLVLQCMLNVFDACLGGSHVLSIAARINSSVDCQRVAKQKAELEEVPEAEAADLQEYSWNESRLAVDGG